MSEPGGHSGSLADAQRDIDYAGTLAGQYAQSQAFDRLASLDSSILQHFGAPYAAPLRARNARATYSLPNELWITTWSLLDPRDVLNVTHVCHGWRLLAVSTPSLWTSVVLTCDFRGQEKATANIYALEGVGIYVTNLRLAQYLLSRTQNLPVSVCVSTSDSTYSPDYLEDVSKLLQVYHSRVMRLDVRCSDSVFFNTLLQLLPQLPALRALTLDDNGSESGLSDGIFCEPIDFPSLEVLTISPSFGWDASTVLLFPSLRKLSFCVYDSGELKSALRACPGLLHLDITSQLAGGPVDRGGWDLTLGPELRRIRTVSIETIVPAEEHAIAEIFGHAPGTDLALTYLGSIPHPPAMRLLHSLANPIRVSYAIIGLQHVRAVFSDASRKISFVWEHGFHVQPKWDQLPPAVVVQLECDAGLWLAVLDSLPDVGSIEELTLRLHSTEDFCRIIQDTNERQTFPSISTLRLHGQCPGIVVDVPGVIALVDRFKLGRRLQTLEVKRSRVEGCLTDLSALADDLRLG